LFPAALAARVPPGRGRRLLAAAAQVAVVLLAAVVLLLRVPGVPAWDTIYAEDYSQFLIGALQHPWHLFIQYNGYEQLLPRVVAQLVTYLPLGEVASGFAVAGALTAALLRAVRLPRQRRARPLAAPAGAARGGGDPAAERADGDRRQHRRRLLLPAARDVLGRTVAPPNCCG
jgi:hypothetical protein